VHIMKALASHPLAAQCMAEDGTLELLFHIVSNGSLSIFFHLRQGLVPLHTVQLYRHAMQVKFSLLNIYYSSQFSHTFDGSPPWQN
jgi:WD repeat and FYVE domain-containing protein 3